MWVWVSVVLCIVSIRLCTVFVGLYIMCAFMLMCSLLAHIRIYRVRVACLSG